MTRKQTKKKNTNSNKSHLKTLITLLGPCLLCGKLSVADWIDGWVESDVGFRDYLLDVNEVKNQTDLIKKCPIVGKRSLPSRELVYDMALTIESFHAFGILYLDPQHTLKHLVPEGMSFVPKRISQDKCENMFGQMRSANGGGMMVSQSQARSFFNMRRVLCSITETKSEMKGRNTDYETAERKSKMTVVVSKVPIYRLNNKRARTSRVSPELLKRLQETEVQSV